MNDPTRFALGDVLGAAAKVWEGRSRSIRPSRSTQPVGGKLSHVALMYFEEPRFRQKVSNQVKKLSQPTARHRRNARQGAPFNAYWYGWRFPPSSKRLRPS